MALRKFGNLDLLRISRASPAYTRSNIQISSISYVRLCAHVCLRLPPDSSIIHSQLWQLTRSVLAVL